MKNDEQRQAVREVEIVGDIGEDNAIPFQYSITSYGADFPVDGLVRRLRDGSIYIPPFQRDYVWDFKQASRFIESLLLGLPVPGVFLSREDETQKLLVIDGQQRLRTLQYFYDGVFHDTGREFALRGVQEQFEGLTYRKLSDEDRRRLDDSIIHATIVKQDEPSDDKSSIYFIFERLNTGGTQLQPQEIRACIFHGKFSDLLKDLNRAGDWRTVFGPVSKRMRDQELILRFFALYFYGGEYKKPMKDFLNKYMGRNRYLQLQDADTLEQAFLVTVEVVANCLGPKAFKPKRALNAALFDAVMVGVARRLAEGTEVNCEKLQQRYKELIKDEAFIAAYETATTDEENIERRIALATKAFEDI